MFADKVCKLSPTCLPLDTLSISSLSYSALKCLKLLFRGLKLLNNRAIAVWLAAWILCPGGAHHIISQLLDHHHHHEGSSLGNKIHALTSGEHVERKQCGNEENEKHPIFDHFQDAVTLRPSRTPLVLPDCPVALVSETYLSEWLDLPDYRVPSNRRSPQQVIIGRAPFREISGVYLL